MRDEWADPAAGELALAARRAREEVKRRALLSAGAVLVPLPGLDVAVDVGVLVSMMNAVNRAFCLSPDQIERLGMEERVAVYEALSGVGAVMAGKSVTGVAALTIAKQLGSRWCAGKTARWVPIVGQGAAAALSYGLVKWLGEQHVRECLAVRSRVAALLPALTIAKQLGSRWCAGKTARWVPIVGQGAAAALSYGLVKWLGEQHVRECLAVRSRVAALLPYEKDSLKKNAQQS